MGSYKHKGGGASHGAARMDAYRRYQAMEDREHTPPPSEEDILRARRAEQVRERCRAAARRRREQRKNVR